MITVIENGRVLYLSRREEEKFKDRKREMLIQRDGPGCKAPKGKGFCNRVPKRGEERHTFHHRKAALAPPDDWSDGNLELRCRPCNTAERGERLGRWAAERRAQLIREEHAHECADGINTASSINTGQASDVGRDVSKPISAFTRSHFDGLNDTDPDGLICVCSNPPPTRPTDEEVDRVTSKGTPQQQTALRNTFLFRRWLRSYAWRHRYLYQSQVVPAGSQLLQQRTGTGSDSAVEKYWRDDSNPINGILKLTLDDRGDPAHVLFCRIHNREPKRPAVEPQQPAQHANGKAEATQ